MTESGGQSAALTRAVWPTMREQAFGRIVNVSSNAALGIGRHTAYSVSEAALWGLAFDAVLEGDRFGIKVNCVLPVAITRTISGLPDREFVDWLTTNFPSELVAEAVVFLVGPDVEAIGRLFSVGGGRIAELGISEVIGHVDAELAAERLAPALRQTPWSGERPRLASSADEIQAYVPHFPWPTTDRN